MASEEIWRARIKAWKESGKRSEDFGQETGIDAGQLRSWTSKLGLSMPRKKKQVKAMQPLPRLAKVVRSSAHRIVLPNGQAKSGITIIMGQAKIDVEVGFDVGTLRTVVAMIEERGR